MPAKKGSLDFSGVDVRGDRPEVRPATEATAAASSTAALDEPTVYGTVPIYENRRVVVGFRQVDPPKPEPVGTLDLDEPDRMMFRMENGAIHDPQSHGVVEVGLPVVEIERAVHGFGMPDRQLCPREGRMDSLRYAPKALAQVPSDLTPERMARFVREVFLEPGPSEGDQYARSQPSLAAWEIQAFQRKTGLVYDEKTVRKLWTDDLHSLVPKYGKYADVCTVRSRVWHHGKMSHRVEGFNFGRLWVVEKSLATRLTRGPLVNFGNEPTVLFPERNPAYQWVCDGMWNRDMLELPPMLAWPSWGQADTPSRLPFVEHGHNVLAAKVVKPMNDWEQHGLIRGSIVVDVAKKVLDLVVSGNLELVDELEALKSRDRARNYLGRRRAAREGLVYQTSTIEAESVQW